MASYRFNASLRVKLAAVTAVQLLFFAALLLLLLPPKLDELSRLGMERRARGMATLLVSAVAPGLEFGDAASVEEGLARLSDAPGTLYAEVRRPDGSRLAAWHGERAEQLPLPPGAEPLLEVRGDALHLVVETRTKGGDRGALALGLSLSELEAERRSNLWFVLLLSGGVFVLGLGLSFLVGTWLARPIRGVSALARLIAQGDLGAAEKALGGRERARALAARTGTEAGRDEVALLEGAFAGMLLSLEDVTGALRDSSGRLGAAVAELVASTRDQTQAVAEHAAALQEAAAVAAELRQTSEVATRQAGRVLEVAGRADALGKEGGEAVSRTRESLGEISARVSEIAARIAELTENSQKIGEITAMVKDLADQSHLLALNAAIEAARAGEHGRSFHVVAHEVRNLADQSIRGTQRVNKLLAELTRTTREAVASTQRGSERVQSGLAQASSSGERIQALTEIVGDNARAAREIAAAISQQEQGLGQVLEAVSVLSRLMEDTRRRIESTSRTAEAVREVSDRVSEVATRYRA